MDTILYNISDLFIDNGLVIVLGCMVLGLFLKGTIKKLPNKFIPLINMVVSIALGYAIPDTYADEDVISKTIILMFLGLTSTGLYEALCIVVKDRFSIDINAIVSKFTSSKKEEDETVTEEESVEEETSETETAEEDTEESTDETVSQESLEGEGV